MPFLGRTLGRGPTKIPTEVIHPNLSDLPGLLLLVVLAVHSDVDHQTT